MIIHFLLFSTDLKLISVGGVSLCSAGFEILKGRRGGNERVMSFSGWTFPSSCRTTQSLSNASVGPLERRLEITLHTLIEC